MKIIFSSISKITGETRCLLIYIHDVLVVTFSFPLSVLIRENFEISDRYGSVFFLGTMFSLVISASLFRMTNLRQGMWRYTSSADLLRILQSVVIIVLIIFSMLFLFNRLENIPRSVLVIFGLLSFVGLSGSRIVYGCFAAANIGSLRGHENQATIRVLIIGNVRSTAGLVQAIHGQYSDFVHIVGVIGRRDDIGRHYHGVTVLGDLSGLKQVLASLDVSGMYPHKIIAADAESDHHPDSLDKVMSAAERHGLEVVRSTRLYELSSMDFLRTPSSRLIRDALITTKYYRAKRVFDFCAAGVALAALFPLLLFIMLAILVTSGRPVFFSQVRAGRHMREFKLIKFRTMRDPIGLSGEILSDAKRVSQFGQLLRLTRLDELPQFWNILVGDMSLVGPRPLHSRDLLVDESILKKRYTVPPGLSGWAQVNGGKLLSSEQKMRLDIEYIETASFVFDIKIMLLTFRTVIAGESINKNIIKMTKNSNQSAT